MNVIKGDVQELKPTDMPMVPRLLNRFYNQVMNQVKGNPIKHTLMKRAIAAKEADRKRLVINYTMMTIQLIILFIFTFLKRDIPKKYNL